MKQKEFKGYVKSSLVNYLNEFKDGTLRYSYLFEKSKTDLRLAELSQAYFLLTDSNKWMNFNDMLKTKYKNKNEFLSDKNNKYVFEYSLYLKNKDDVKDLYRSKLTNYVKKLNLTMYKVSKLSKTNQSNVTKFFKGDNKSLSEKKLSYLLRVLRRTVKLTKSY